MAKNTKKSLSSKSVSLIVLAVLLVLTLAFTVFGMTGGKRGGLYYYQSWIPACFNSWPESIKLSKDIGGKTTATFSGVTEENTNTVKDVLNKRLNILGVYDAKVTIDGENASVIYPADANAALIESAVVAQGSVSVTWNSAEVLTETGIASAKGYSTATYPGVLSVSFNKEGKKALKEAIGDAKSGTLDILVDGSSLMGSSGLSMDDVSFVDKGLVLYMNSSDTAEIQSKLFASLIAGGNLGSALTATEATTEYPTSYAALVIILAVAAIAGIAVMLVFGKRDGIAGVWGLVLFIGILFLCIAELLYHSGYITVIAIILIALTELLFAYNFISCQKCINTEKAVRGSRAAITFGFKDDMKMFYITNGAVFAVGFILGFITPIAIYGFILMLAVLLNIVLNRLFVRWLRMLFDKVFVK